MQDHLERFLRFSSKTLALEKSNIRPRSEALLSIALVFPNNYEVGMANLGYQTLYRLLNEAPGVRCERVFDYKSFPDTTRSLESAQRLTQFDVIAFSVSFEPDYLNVIKILMNSGLNPFAGKRNARDPIILAGGTATFINPEPLAPFIDLFFLGEIEPQLDSILETFRNGAENRIRKPEIIHKLSYNTHIYAPNIDIKTADQLHVSIAPRDTEPQYSTIITPRSHFENMFLVEVGRGCGRRCRFCAASHIYHPLRFFSTDQILDTIEKNIPDAQKIGLVGAALCDFPDISGLCETLVKKKYKLGLSSFRFETISDKFLNVLNEAQISTITLAPEAGTFRLRSIINKPISHELIMNSFRHIAKSEISTIKLYFLIGLPFEEENDISGIVDLVQEARNILNSDSKRKKMLTVSVNAFIPKPFTPFQWSPIASEKHLKWARRKIAAGLKSNPGVVLTQKNTRNEMLQAILALGSRSISNDLAQLMSSGMTLQTFIEKHKSICVNQKKYDTTLPWDFISYRIKKETLWKSWLSAESYANSLK